jgi:hypothetical protein
MDTPGRDDSGLVTISFLAVAVGIASLCVHNPALAWVAIAATDLDLVNVLVVAAMQSDTGEVAKRHRLAIFLPHRHTAGLLIVALKMLTLVFGFAGLYVGTDVFPSGKTRLDAVYISLFTMGFTDYSPRPGYGQLVVIAQIVSSMLLLAGAFPLLLSRISTFKRL